VQVGFIFIELSLGWTAFALFHVASHAVYRSLQLIVSPSIITHVMNLKANDRETNAVRRSAVERLLPKNVRQSLYVLAIQENYLEHGLERLIVSPLHAYKSYRRRIGSFVSVMLSTLAFVGYVAGYQQAMAYVVVLLGLNLAIQAALEKGAVKLAIDRILLSQLSLALAALIVVKGPVRQELVNVLMAMIPFGLLLKGIIWSHGRLNLTAYSGLFKVKPMTAWLLFFAMGGLIGLPPLPGFFFEDLVMSSFLDIGPWCALLAGFSLAITGIAGFRVCSLVTMGRSSASQNLQSTSLPEVQPAKIMSILTP
jgi:NADH-quinone oxidoreductase subunit L